MWDWEHPVEVDGTSYRLTFHGRERFLNRRGMPYSTHPSVIVRMALDDPEAVWKPDRSTGEGYALITVLPEATPPPPNARRFRRTKTSVGSV